MITETSVYPSMSWLPACKCHFLTKATSPCRHVFHPSDLISAQLSKQTLILTGDWHRCFVCWLLWQRHRHVAFICMVFCLPESQTQIMFGVCDSWCHGCALWMSQSIEFAVVSFGHIMSACQSIIDVLPNQHSWGNTAVRCWCKNPFNFSESHLSGSWFEDCVSVVKSLNWFKV